MSIFLAAGEQSEWECEGNHQLLNFFLGTDYLARLASEAFGVDGESVQYQDAAFHLDEEASQLGKLIEHRLRSNDPVGPLEVDAWAQLTGLHALRRYSSINRCEQPSRKCLMPSRLKAAIEYIHSNYSSPLRLAAIAASVGMSQYSFSRAFRNSTGTTPHQYLTKVRIEHARVLLASGEQQLSEIAAAVGFADQSHLTAQFRKAVGTTPARYRRACQG